MKHPQRGFTLIELLIALAVMAIFALLAYRGLDSVLRLHQGAYAHEQHAQAIDRSITQLEADLRQASKVTVLAPTTDGASPRLQIRRRVEGSVTSELATVEWMQTGSTLLRRTTLGSDIQSAELLQQISELTWLTFNMSANNIAGKWQMIQVAEIAAQPTKSLAITRGFGLRLSVAGKPLEKVFLVGR
jgi:type II secretion system protein J